MEAENNPENSDENASKPLKIALIHVINDKSKSSMNKDLNGGFGTSDYFGESFTSKALMKFKKKNVRLPIITLAFLQAIFKSQGHQVSYFEGSLPKEKFDLGLIYGTIVDISNENNVLIKLKAQFPDSKIGFIGPFPATRPDLFASGDFVLLGESEGYFMNDFKSLDGMKGQILVATQTDLDALPSPDYSGFPLNKYSYSPAIAVKPFVPLIASKGCPYSCKAYCVYGNYQGPKIRQRSAQKVVDDIIKVQKEFGVKGVQFRDPVFGLNRAFIPQFCEEIKKRNVKIYWGMETRLDILNEENLKQMFDAGLRNINVGIETIVPEIAKKNKRLLVQTKHQEKIIAICKKLGIKISAFYIIGYMGDTIETVENTIKYAIKLNTSVARFCVSTPYPGTQFYYDMSKEDKLLTKDYEQYTQFNLVYKHENFTPDQITNLLQGAYRKYYYRPTFLFSTLMWKIRDLRLLA